MVNFPEYKNKCPMCNNDCYITLAEQYVLKLFIDGNNSTINDDNNINID